jgi:hypothetical protein
MRKVEENADARSRPDWRGSAPRIMVAAEPAERAYHPSVKIASLKSLSFLARMFRCHVRTKQFSQATKPFSVFEQTSGNSGWLSVTNETAHNAPESETANADDQLYPGLRLHPGRSFDSWFFRRQPAGHRHLLLQRLVGCLISDDGRCRELILDYPNQIQKKM